MRARPYKSRCVMVSVLHHSYVWFVTLKTPGTHQYGLNRQLIHLLLNISYIKQETRVSGRDLLAARVHSKIPNSGSKTMAMLLQHKQEYKQRPLIGSWGKSRLSAGSWSALKSITS